MLTEDQVIRYLLDRDLVSAEALVRGDLAAIDASRRNCNYKIISEQGPCYLVKQGADADRIATVAHEAAVYRRVHEHGFGGLSRYLPRFCGHDAERNMLILEFLRDARDLRAYHTAHKRFPKAVGAAMGEVLAVLHRASPLPADRASDRREGSPHWSFAVHRPGLEALYDISAANLHVLRVIQSSTEFCRLLDDICDQWRTETLIHFDARWDNWMISRSSSPADVELKLVDWELADFGDPCWDLACIFSEYLGCWLLSIPITGETPPERFAELAHFPLNRMRPAIRAFWRAYARHMALDDAGSQERLLRAVKYTAARLIQAAYEQTQVSVQVTGNAICFLQLSLNILQRPHEAAVHLLGIPLTAARSR